MMRVFLFVLDQNSVECYNRNKSGKTAEFVKTLQQGGAFTKQVDQNNKRCYT